MLSSTIAKWLLPSVTVLFGIIGYVVDSAQADMLGIGGDGGATAAYFIIAAGFLSDTATFAADLLFDRSLPLGGHAAGLIVATVLTGAVLILPMLPAVRRFAHPALVPAVLILLLAGKFLILDAPLFEARLSLFADGDAADALAAAPGARTAPAAGPPTNFRTARLNRAKDLSDAVLCSRVGRGGEMLNPEQRLRMNDEHRRCDRPISENQRWYHGHYIAQLWMAALIVTLAVTLLGSAVSAGRIALGIFGLVYLLTLPYAYGKLMRSTQFDYGNIYLAGSAAKGNAEASALHGIVLSRSSAGVNLLIAYAEDCPGHDATDEKDRPRCKTVSKSWFAASQIGTIDEIYSRDVIAWSVENDVRSDASANDAIM